MKTNRISAVVFIVALVGVVVFTLATCLQQENFILVLDDKPAQQYSQMLGSALDETLHVQNAKTMLNYYVNLREQDGMYIGENRLIKIPLQPDRNMVQRNISYIRDFVWKNAIPTYLMIIPSAATVLTDQLPSFTNHVQESQMLDETMQDLNGYVTSIDVLTTLQIHQEEDIFYRTDEHLTSLGAFYCYLEASERMGLSHVTRDNFNIEYLTFDFYGNLYQKVPVPNIQPDRIEAYHYGGTGEMTDSVVAQKRGVSSFFSSVYQREYLQSNYPYAVFGGQGYEYIRVQSQRPYDKNKTLLIIKDSSADSMIQFFMLHYKNLDIIDIDQLAQAGGDVLDYLDTEQHKQVFICVSAETFAQNDNLRVLLEQN